MERNHKDSEGNCAQKNFQRNSNETAMKENQLPMEIPNDVESSGNGTTTDDLSPAPSDDRSPMLTPNTTQDWLNEENIETTIHQDEAIPARDRIKKSNLEEGTQNLIYWNPENAEDIEQHTETVTGDSSLEHSEQSSVIEDQPQEIMEDEPKQLPSELPEEEELYNCETAPKLEQKLSCIFEEQTKNWLTEEYPNLENMFSDRTFQTSLSEETMLRVQNKLQKNTQNWADASATNRYGDTDLERSSGSQRSKSVYLNGLKPHADEILPRKEPSIPEECRIQPVTVKFLINKMRAFTCAFGVHTYIHEVKETLSRTLRCQPVDLQLIKNGVALSDRLEISELGVEPYGTVEIEMKAKESLKTESMYDVPIVPDIITVRVESAADEVRDVVVEIESKCIRKPFFGGYRHKTTGVEYHHAFTQTPSLYFKASAGGKICRDTQTADWREKQQNTCYDVATQMYKTDHYVPCYDDKILEAKRYIEADDLERHADLEAKVIIIQRHWRGYTARQRFSTLKLEQDEYLHWEGEERMRSERERDECLRKETVRKIFPRTRADYEMLYAMVENWRKAEIKRISSMKTVAPKKAEFCLLLKKEIESLNAIERYRLELKKEKLAKKELSIMEKCATPITWTGYKGKEVTMETVHIQRAKELKELYYIMCQDNITAKERIELLISLKYALKSYSPMMTNELMSLFERECNCLLHGVKSKDLASLRQRTQKHFIELMKNPEFNPEAAKHTVYDWKGNEGKMNFCQRCQRLKPFNEFSISARTQMLERCISCAWTDEIARSRIDLEPYRFMIRSLRRDERRHKCFSSLAFIMQDKDFYNLIVNIWHCRSPLSEVADTYKLRLGRWDVTKEWTPWNCVLLTSDEMRTHIEVRNIEETYAPDFIADVRLKHRLAECQFSHLFKFDKQLLGSRKWLVMKDTKGYKPLSQQSGDT